MVEIADFHVALRFVVNFNSNRKTKQKVRGSNI
nr:MAG TPA: hypothetical protein [Caudoviricetes sp.]